MKPEIILDMPADTYRSAEGIAGSDLKHIAPPRTPAHYFANVIQPRAKEETRAMLIGTLAHLAILEPEKAAGAFAIRPEGLDLRTKPGKEWQASVGNLPALTQAEADALRGMAEAVARHEAARTLLEGADMEASLFAEHPATGLPIKGRVDALGAGVIVDLKTCEDASPAAFASQAARLLYDLSAAHYMALAELCGRPVSSYWWLAVEKSPPYAVALYEPSEAFMARGLRLAEQALATIKECADAGEWPGYPLATVLELPKWAATEVIAWRAL